MVHSIYFGTLEIDANTGKFTKASTKNTYDDWFLLPTSKPIVAQASVSTSFVDIPGRKDGPIDLSEYLTGGPVYGQRSGSFEFYIEPDHEYWETIRRDIAMFLHGRRMKMVLEDDPGYYYEGRFSLSQMTSEAITDKITITYAVGPYKYRIKDNEPWLWDPFNFENDRTDRQTVNTGWL